MFKIFQVDTEKDKTDPLLEYEEKAREGNILKDHNELERGEIAGGDLMDKEDASVENESGCCNSILTKVLWVSNFFFLVIVWFPIADYTLDVITFVTFLVEGGDFFIYGIILSVIFTLSLRLQTFLYYDFFCGDPGGDVAIYNSRDITIMLCPILGTVMASFGKVGCLTYEPDNPSFVGRIMWIILLETSLWCGIPFMLFIRFSWMIQEFWSWVSFLFFNCQREPSKNPREISTETVDREHILRLKGKQVFIASASQVEIFTEQLPQLVINIIVMSTIGVVVDTQFLSLITKVFKAVKIIRLSTRFWQSILNKCLNSNDTAEDGDTVESESAKNSQAQST